MVEHTHTQMKESVVMCLYPSWFGTNTRSKLLLVWFLMGTVHDVWVKQRSKLNVVPVSLCSSLSPLSIYLFLFVLVCLYPCVTGSSQPLCRWWLLVWSQMTPLYSQSDVSYRLYDSIFGWLQSLSLSQLTASITLHVLGLFIEPFPHLCSILIGWLWGCLIIIVQWDDCGL